jgi:acetolactate synthase-1/2/3 large subunit
VISLFNLLKKKEIIVCADGAATVVPNQVGYLNKGCKLIYNSGSASMGYELPAAIGAAIASPKRKIICLAGDGSIMMNLQELQSIVALKLNIVIFLINNGGYLSIKQTQNNFFKSEFGSSSKSGLTFPDFIKVAKSFNFNSYNLNKPANLKKKIEDILKKEGPMFINVDVDQIQEFEPRLKSKIIKNKIVTPDLEDMYPFLDPSEINFLKKQL